MHGAAAWCEQTCLNILLNHISRFLKMSFANKNKYMKNVGNWSEWKRSASEGLNCIETRENNMS